MVQDFSKLMRPDHVRLGEIEERLSVLENDLGVIINHLGQLANVIQQHQNNIQTIGIVVAGHHAEAQEAVEKVERKIKRVSMAVTAIRGGADVLGEQPVSEDERVDASEGQVGSSEGGPAELAFASADESTDEDSRPDGGDHQ
jgi:archaellum component FlaC